VLGASPSIAGPDPPPFAYPLSPQLAGGGDPLRAVPPPRECSPARDRPGRSYVPLASLKQRPADNPFVRGDQGSVSLDLTNRKGQVFRIYVSASTRAMVQRFVRTSTACYEAFALPKAPRPGIGPVQFDELLIGAAAAVTGLSPAALAARRDGLMAFGAAGTLDDVLSLEGADPATVVARAAGEAASALAAKVASGELSSTEVAALDPAGIMEQLAALPGAPFLRADRGQPEGAAQLAAQLRSGPGGVVIVGAVAVSKLPARQNVVWFAFDPTFTITAPHTHSFVAQCHKGAWAQIYSWKGSQTVSLKRLSPFSHDFGSSSAYAGAAYPYSAQLGETTAPGMRAYDAAVHANTSGRYSIYGAYVWVKGGGGGCP
jgi:hypothetical protein